MTKIMVIKEVFLKKLLLEICRTSRLAAANADERSAEGGVNYFKMREILEVILKLLKMKEVLEIISTIVLGFLGWRLTDKHHKITTQISTDNLQKQLFTEFNARYDKLNDIIQLVINLNESEIKRFEAASATEIFGELKKLEVTFKINDYFNLCAEEYYWYKKGRIEGKIWFAWHKGMTDIYDSSVIIQKQWQQEIKNEGWRSFYLDTSEDLFRNL